LDEVQISKVAAVLAEWNLLGSRADSVSDLDGYRIEAKRMCGACEKDPAYS
jgi:hypothetical protein